eukprot:Lankesteria_metandrocarpae@DN5332_c0_g1_i1.p1
MFILTINGDSPISLFLTHINIQRTQLKELHKLLSSLGDNALQLARTLAKASHACDSCKKQIRSVIDDASPASSLESGLSGGASVPYSAEVRQLTGGSAASSRLTRDLYKSKKGPRRRNQHSAQTIEADDGDSGVILTNVRLGLNSTTSLDDDFDLLSPGENEGVHCTDENAAGRLLGLFENYKMNIEAEIEYCLATGNAFSGLAKEVHTISEEVGVIRSKYRELNPKVAKEYNTSKASLFRSKSRYEKAIKDGEAALHVRDKARVTAANASNNANTMTTVMKTSMKADAAFRDFIVAQQDHDKTVLTYKRACDALQSIAHGMSKDHYLFTHSSVLKPTNNIFILIIKLFRLHFKRTHTVAGEFSAYLEDMMTEMQTSPPGKSFSSQTLESHSTARSGDMGLGSTVWEDAAVGAAISSGDGPLSYAVRHMNSMDTKQRTLKKLVEAVKLVMQAYEVFAKNVSALSLTNRLFGESCNGIVLALNSTINTIRVYATKLFDANSHKVFKALEVSMRDQAELYKKVQQDLVVAKRTLLKQADDESSPASAGSAMSAGTSALVRKVTVCVHNLEISENAMISRILIGFYSTSQEMRGVSDQALKDVDCQQTKIDSCAMIDAYRDWFCSIIERDDDSPHNNQIAILPAHGTGNGQDVSSHPSPVLRRTDSDLDVPTVVTLYARQQKPGMKILSHSGDVQKFPFDDESATNRESDGAVRNARRLLSSVVDTMADTDEGHQLSSIATSSTSAESHHINNSDDKWSKDATATKTEDGTTVTTSTVASKEENKENSEDHTTGTYTTTGTITEEDLLYSSSPSQICIRDQLKPSDYHVPPSSLLEFQESIPKFTSKALKSYTSPCGEFKIEESEMVVVTVPCGDKWQGVNSAGVRCTFPPDLVEVPSGCVWASPPGSVVDRFFADFDQLFGTVGGAAVSSSKKDVSGDSSTAVPSKTAHMGQPVWFKPPVGVQLHRATRSSSHSSSVVVKPGSTATTSTAAPSESSVGDLLIDTTRGPNVHPSSPRPLALTSRIESAVDEQPIDLGLSKGKTSPPAPPADSQSQQSSPDQVTSDVIPVATPRWMAVSPAEEDVFEAVTGLCAEPDKPLHRTDESTEEFRTRFRPLCRSSTGHAGDVSAPLLLPQFLSRQWVLQHYTCAMQRRIILQGRLYVTPTVAAFFSPFNEATIFGIEPTLLIIPIINIVDIRPRTTFLMFPTGIEIETIDGGTHIFASLIARDKTIDFLTKLMKTVHQLKGMPTSEEPPLFTVPIAPLTLVAVNDNLNTSQDKRLLNIFPLIKCQKSAKLIFDELFAPLGEDCCLEDLLAASGGMAFDFDKVSWRRHDEPVPQSFTEFAPTGTSPFKMVVNYTRKIKRSAVTALVGIPEQGAATDTMELHVISNTCFVLESFSQVKIPFGDKFITHTRYRVEECDGGESQLDLEGEVLWLKPAPLVSRKVESEMASTTRELIPVLRRVLVRRLGLDTAHSAAYEDKTEDLSRKVANSWYWDRIRIVPEFVLLFWNVVFMFASSVARIFVNPEARAEFRAEWSRLFGVLPWTRIFIIVIIAPLYIYVIPALFILRKEVKQLKLQAQY